MRFVVEIATLAKEHPFYDKGKAYWRVVDTILGVPDPVLWTNQEAAIRVANKRNKRPALNKTFVKHLSRGVFYADSPAQAMV